MVRPRTVLVINNNPDNVAGRYTPMLMRHLADAGSPVHEARSVQAVDEYASEVLRNGGAGDIGLIVSCGSPVVLTEPVDVAAHVAKTTAAMLLFPNAPIVGICFGAQLLSILYGGILRAIPDIVRNDAGERAAFAELRRTDQAGVTCCAPGRSRLLGDLEEVFVQWCSNYIFIERTPSRFEVTATDMHGRPYCLEHEQEHVYGVLFHPEMLGDRTKRVVLDAIINLAGQNRRIKPSARRTWQCSANCPRRLAVRDLTRSDSAVEVAAPPQTVAPVAEAVVEDAVGSIAGATAAGHLVRQAAVAPLAPAARRRGRGGGGYATLDREVAEAPQRLAGRLALAKREALLALQRDHCYAGGITLAALEDAIISLRKVAGVSHEAAERRGFVPFVGAGICTLQDADLRLRGVVRDVLTKGTPPAGGGAAEPLSRNTSVGSTQSGRPVPDESDDGTQSKAGVPTPSERALKLHEVDLRLRRLVQDLLAERGGAAVLGGPAPASCAAAAKRDALAALRQRARDTGGLVSPEAVAEAESALRASFAAAFATSPQQANLVAATASASASTGSGS